MKSPRVTVLSPLELHTHPRLITPRLVVALLVLAGGFFAANFVFWGSLIFFAGLVWRHFAH